MPDEIYHHLLRAAVAEGNLFRVKRFITRSKVPLRCPNPENGWPILFYAIRYNQNDIVNFLLDSGHDEREISKDFTNTTALMIAATHKNEKVLLDMGAEVNSADGTGSTPLHHAAAWGYFDLINLLMERGALYNIKNARGWTPFDWAFSVEIRDHLQGRFGDHTIDILHLLLMPFQNAQPPLQKRSLYPFTAKTLPTIIITLH
ncbi:ankyrin repeat-containing domain protein [Phlyctochytrium arcticum]|nr:ankyrin repeat-containing domain protein [Phlyctochytrium arcticum]